ncbi:hypothetical protein KP509_17G079900 [Ceratopteris richardii]|uniref:Uncharacterized protein n=1 Tax=Ceratopteris richardii TaxID=49495 RepID=A0A8T2SXS8_CERRI|nr:hypothetical protein KP509_17G079900 [Ceratopteris richardii]
MKQLRIHMASFHLHPILVFHYFIVLPCLATVPFKFRSSTHSALSQEATRTTRSNILKYQELPDFPNGTYLDRSSFPSDFKFGTLTLAVKHEGNSSHKVESIWDTYALVDGVVLDGTTPAQGGDQYNRYPEDIEYMVAMGVDAFRFSLAWTRIFPDRSGEPNAEAIAHYNDMIDKLVAEGIEPHVTLWSEDHPQALEDAYDGLLSPLFIDDFATYANVCFAEFGDRVKYWITFDEPNDYVGLAYASNQSPPGRCSSCDAKLGNCTKGNSSTEPYIVAHHILLAHAAAAKLYKDQYQDSQEGYIGISLWFKWYEPLNSTDEVDLASAKQAQNFYFGWFMDPLAFGDYPENMRTLVGARLPTFTEQEAIYLRESFDFVGINVVTASYVTSGTDEESCPTYFNDMNISITAYRDGEAIGEGENEYSVPWCIEKIVNYMRDVYGNPLVYITEIGWGISFTSDIQENLNDTERIQFYYSYLSTLSEAIRSSLSPNTPAPLLSGNLELNG